MLKPTEIQIENPSNALILEGFPWSIYIIHEIGLHVEQLSSRNSKEFAIAAYYKLCAKYRDQKIAASLFSPEGERILLEMIDPIPEVN